MQGIERLSPLDASFLHLEGPNTPMHVAAVGRFDAHGMRRPDGGLDADRLRRGIAARLHLAPRFRQKVAFVPLGQGRPQWVDDLHFNLHYHVRFTALPRPGGDAELDQLVGRLLSQPLDRGRPLWELYFVDHLADGGTALIWKTHHAMVDGVSGVELGSLIFDLSPDAEAPPDPPAWEPRPPPGEATRLVDALVERAGERGEQRRSLGEALRHPLSAFEQLEEVAQGMASLVGGGLAPETCLNPSVGPHRRFARVAVPLEVAKRVKNALGGTVNDVVLAAVGGALARFFRRRGEPVDGLRLRVFVPVSIRPPGGEAVPGNHVSGLVVRLPLDVEDPAELLSAVTAETRDVKRSRQALGAEVLTELSGFAPATLLKQAVRLPLRQRFVNLVVTNVPGPQFPLYLAGARLLDVYPGVPIGPGLALAVGCLSYDGSLGFGLTADWDALPDLEELASDLRASFDALDGRARAS